MNDLSEKEQLDELRAWWQENRAWVLSGIAIGIAVIVGMRVWSNTQLTTSVEASSKYEALVNEVADDNLEPAKTIADDLFANHEGTVYADQSRLAMARLYMDRGRDGDAAEVLRPLAAAGGDEPIKRVARLRLARILLYQDKAEEVLDLLKTPGDSAFAARYNEVIGDANFALGNMDKAAAAYTAALADVRGQQTIDQALVRMKLNDLPQNTDAAEVSAANAADDSAVVDDLPDDGDQE